MVVKVEVGDGQNSFDLYHVHLLELLDYQFRYFRNFVICLTVSYFTFLSERVVVFSVFAVLDEFNVRNHKKSYFNLIPMNDSTF